MAGSAGLANVGITCVVAVGSGVGMLLGVPPETGVASGSSTAVGVKGTGGIEYFPDKAFYSTTATTDRLVGVSIYSEHPKAA